METTDLNAAVVAGVTWRKSSRSGANGGQCVEVARSPLGIIAVRDGKNPGVLCSSSPGASGAPS